ncbi:MAG: hypothetical protein JO301_16625 [Chitinophagaceae bacterium]|nr:hypothetical protein [Chitinophagaceae bacterium]
MKIVALAFLFGLSCTGASAQGTKKTTSTTKAPEPLVAKEAIFSGIESTLADGKVKFTRKLTVSESGASKTGYYLRNKNAGTFTYTTPIEVQLDEGSFKSYFQRTSAESQKLPALLKYAQDLKLSFSDEQAWAKVIAYYNSLD